MSLERLASLTLLAALAALPLPAPGQGPPPPSDPPAAEAPAVEATQSLFFEALDVEVVNVEVFVTDRRGEPVTGLEAADFALFEDGREVEISNFYAVAGGSPEPPAAAPPPPPAPDAAPPPEVPAPLPEAQRLYLVLYFDNLHLRPTSRNRVIRQARSFLARHVTAEDRVMVVTFERTLHVRQPFTDDPVAVRDALFELETLTGYAVQRGQERRQVIRDVEASRSFAEAEPWVDFYARERFLDLERSLDSLRRLIATLGGIAGRKALLYVSDGLPMVAAADLFHLLDLRFGEGASGSLRAQRYSARGDLRQLTAAANANRVTLYTLDAAGLRAHESLSAASGAVAGGSMIEIDMTAELNRQEPLEMMALDTGGQATFNSSNFAGALERMGRDFTSYYSLGYVPAHGGDGRRHRLEVRPASQRLRRHGLELRHRSGYRAKSAETRLTEGVLAALHHGGGTNPLDLSLELGAGRRGDGGHYRVPVTVTVPFARVTLVPTGAFHRGRLRLVLAVIDGDGDTSPPESVELPLEIPDQALAAVRREDVVYEAELEVRRGRHRVAVALRDEISGETAIVRRAIDAGSEGNPLR